MQHLQAWDGTDLTVHHDSPGDTIVERLGVAMEAFITAGGEVIIPADMDPTSPWAVEARTGELVNLTAARAFLTRHWPLDGASISYGGIDVTADTQAYRWEIWDHTGRLVDLVRTPTVDWTMKTLTAELHAAGWQAHAGAADPFTDHPDHATPVPGQGVRIRPGRPFRWLQPTTTTPAGPRRWPVTSDELTHAHTGCRTLGRAGLRAATTLTTATVQRSRAEAAFVAVVDRHLSRPLFVDPQAVAPCSCEGLRHRDPLSGHAPWCWAHEPALLHTAAQRRLALPVKEHQ